MSRAISLTPAEAASALTAWAGIARDEGLEDRFLQQLSKSCREGRPARLRIDEFGHLSGSVAAWLKKGVAEVDARQRKAWLGKLRIIEHRYFVLVSSRQLEKRSEVSRRGVFSLLVRRLQAGGRELQDEIEMVLGEGALVVGYSAGVVPSARPDPQASARKPVLSFAYPGSSPRLEAVLASFDEDAGGIVRDYEQWAEDNSIREYTGAIRNGLLAAVPVIALASGADAFVLPWLEREAPAIFHSLKTLLEIIIRFITGYSVTISIWLELEGGVRKAVAAMVRRSAARSQAQTVYRAAALGTLAGPLAIVLASIAGVSNTAAAYAVVAMFAASSDNFIAALTQLNIGLGAGKEKGLGRRLGSAFGHPFFVANIGAISLLTLLDMALRLATRGRPFGLLSGMGVEGLLMGVGDTFLVWAVLKGLEALKVSRVLERYR